MGDAYEAMEMNRSVSKVELLEKENAGLKADIVQLNAEVAAHKLQFEKMTGVAFNYRNALPDIKADAIVNAADNCCEQHIGHAEYNDLLEYADKVRSGKS